MKYKANFWANNGTRFMKPIEDSNLKRIIKDIRNSAEGNRFEGCSCSWEVWMENEKGNKIIIAAGGKDINGKRYRINKEELKWL